MAAADWYFRAAVQGDPEAIDECWECLLIMDSAGLRDEAISLAKRAPLSMDVRFQRYLSQRAFEINDIEQLIHWSRLVATNGKTEDMVYAGMVNLTAGKAGDSIALLKEASLRPDGVRANQILGEIYNFGLGTQVDRAKASFYYTKAANAGYLLSIRRLLALNTGGGVFKRLLAAIKLARILVKSIFLSSVRPSDPRLADISNLKPPRKGG